MTATEVVLMIQLLIAVTIGLVVGFDDIVEAFERVGRLVRPVADGFNRASQRSELVGIVGMITCRRSVPTAPDPFLEYGEAEVEILLLETREDDA